MRYIVLALVLLASSPALAGTTCTQIGNTIYCTTTPTPTFGGGWSGGPKTTTCTVIGGTMYCN